MDTLEIMDCQHNRFDTGVKLEDIDSLYVIVLSGDEFVTVILNDGTQKVFDSSEMNCSNKSFGFFDGEYGVHKDDLAEWGEREDSYSWFGRMQKDAKM